MAKFVSVFITDKPMYLSMTNEIPRQSYCSGALYTGQSRGEFLDMWRTMGESAWRRLQEMEHAHSKGGDDDRQDEQA